MELGLALASCAIATGILFLIPPLTFLQTVWHATFDGDPTLSCDTWGFLNKDTWQVLLLVVFILILSRSMKDAGALEQLVGSFGKFFRDNRFTIGALPAMIGLLPMPGGALVSAPMIEGLSDEAKLSAEDRTYLNYWFRHVWEYSYPLYPGLILSAAILGVELTELIRFQFPLSLAAILGGSLFGLLGIEKHFRDRLNGREIWDQVKELVSGFWPILLIIIALTGFKIPFIVVLIVVVPLFGYTRLGAAKFHKTAREALDFKIIGTIYAVLVFKDILNASGAVDDVSVVFDSWGVPPIVLFMVFPLLIGYLNGITHAYVSVAFPLLLPFFTAADGSIDLAKVQLAYTFGFIGVIFSPVHLCLVLSTKYFKADINRVFKKLVLPSIVLAIVSLLMFYFS